MDHRVPKRLPEGKLTATKRYLGLPSHAPLPTTTTFAAAEELHEDDVVFFTAEPYTEPNHIHSHTTTNNNNHSSANHHHHCKAHLFAGHDSFGILAALPENVISANNLRNPPQVFHNHRASVSSAASSFSSSSSSSSASFSSSVRAIPRTPQHHHDRLSSYSSSFFKRPMSAPVDMPMVSEAAAQMQRTRREIEADHGEEYKEDGERLPPHEMVAQKEAQTPVLSCSVLEGAGRTLKGRDMRRVRNTVWRQTGWKLYGRKGLAMSYVYNTVADIVAFLEYR